MRRTHRPRCIAIPRRTDDVQPAAIVATIGLIATLMLMWVGLVL